ncbi:MAG: polysaccharide biosynthesis tyrosine autokinase [Burkholderiaceae bacterium]
MAVQPPIESEPLTLECWRALRAHGRAILGAVGAVAAITGAIVFAIAPSYSGTATVMVDPGRSKVLSSADITELATREYFQTQTELLRSREVAERVFAKYELASLPEFAQRASPWSRLRAMLGLDDGTRNSDVAPTAPTPDMIRAFQKKLSVDPLRQTNLVRVSFEAHDPELAARIANGIVDAYFQADVDTREALNERSAKWIDQRLHELKTRLESSEHALQAYRKSQGLIDGRTTTLNGAGKNLENVAQKLLEARVRRSEAEQSYREAMANGDRAASVPAVVRDPSVQRAKEQLAAAETHVARMSEELGTRHPKLASAQNELAVAQANLARQVKAVVESLGREYRAAAAIEQSLEKESDASKATIQELNRKDIGQSELEREVQVNSQLYNTFLAKLKETNATAEAQPVAARVVDRAVPDPQPVAPAKVPIIAASSAFTFFLALGLAVTRKRMNHSLKSTDDVEKKLATPLLAAVPQMSAAEAGSPGQVMLDAPHGRFAEAIRTASTGIRLATVDARRKIIVVTSSSPGDGKSTIAANLALAMSSNRKVLLIEADLRRPVVADLMKIGRRRPGLTDLVAGTHSPAQCVVSASDNLHLLLAGSRCANATSLLESDRFSAVLNELSNDHDVIVMDTPPVHAVSDALVISTHASGTVFVIKSDHTDARLARNCLDRLDQAGANVLGVILNQHDFERARRLYGEHSVPSDYDYASYQIGWSDTAAPQAHEAGTTATPANDGRGSTTR